MASSRVGILERNESVNARPRHIVSRRLAEAVVAGNKGKWCGKKVIQLISSECWASTRIAFKEVKTARGVELVVPQLKVYRREEHFSLMLHYPPTDQTSYAKRRFLEIWGSNAPTRNELN